MYRKIFFLLFISAGLFFSNLRASCNTACASGTWENSSTWSKAIVPDCFDTIMIPAGYVVTITTQLDYTGCSGPMVIVIYGELKFQTGKKIKLPCNSYVIVKSGGKISAGTGGGSSDYIEICNTIVWSAASGPLYGPTTLTCCGPLPIELVTFDAKPEGRKIQLSWQTASELKNSFFTIERSADGISFQALAFVPGAGTSNLSHTYESEDESPLQGISYYRLKQTDFDGKSEHFNIVEVNFSGNQFVLYPNPNSGKFILQLKNAKEELVQILNCVGEKVYDGKISNGANPFELSLLPGIYLLSIPGSANQPAVRFVVE
jgi:hypothetical protein